MYFSELAAVSGGKLLSAGTDEQVFYLLTDSRKLINAAGAVFFAIRGERHDGHKFLREAYKKGIRLFVTEKGVAINPEQFPEAAILQVENSVAALQKVAAAHRQQFLLPLIAITGSNGKTIVKEWLANLLSLHEQLIRSPRSFNSQIGVPLSVWQITSQHTIGIFEAGISQKGEMQNLAEILQPQIGIFTNLGPAHSEGFASMQEKAAEKSLLFRDCHTIFYCQDHILIHQTLQAAYPDRKLMGWSTENTEAPVYIRQQPVSGGVETELSGLVKGKFFLPFREAASVENALHCICCYLYLGYPAESLLPALQNLHALSMRLELKQGVNQSYIIDDTYNNDLAGLRVALEFMQQQKQAAKKTVILSDILEAGVPAKKLYAQVAFLLKNYGVSRLTGIGPGISKEQQAFQALPETSFYPDTESFLAGKPENETGNELVLVKGARIFGFERIVQRLQQKIHGTVLEINLDALTHNLNFYRSRLKPGTKMMVMVKAFAYGSGSHEVAQLLQFQKVDYLAVAYADEGVGLRQAGIDLPIMIMNPAPDSFAKMAEYRLEPEIYSLTMLRDLSGWLKKENKQMGAHLKLDTGMHRLGLEKDDLKEAAALLQENSSFIKLNSIFSHLAGADSAEFNDFSHEQVRLLQECAQLLAQDLPYRPLLHIVNSAGILRFPEYHFDMVRLGIGLYGAEVNRTEQDSLQAISTLKTTISQIKHIQKGDSVGYSRSGKAEEDMKIATIAIGYADGFDRRFSNRTGSVLVKGKPAPVVGRVCMDMTMVDISGISAKEGDEVIIFGPGKPITELADSIGTIPYEILTNIGERVKRVFYMS